MVINTIIILIGSVFFGWSMMMYAIILVFINNMMIDKVLLGISSNKAFYIVTTKDKEIIQGWRGRQKNVSPTKKKIRG